MPSSVTTQTFNENWMTRLMEPAPNATDYKEIIEKAYDASQTQDDFVKRHFEPAGYGSLAWVVAFFDTLTFTGKMLTESVIFLVERNYDEALEALKTNTFDAYYSAKQLVLLPFIIFAGIFFPDHVFGQMHYPNQLASFEQIQGREEEICEPRRPDPENERLATENQQLRGQRADNQQENERLATENQSNISRVEQERDGLQLQLDEANQQLENIRIWLRVA